MVAIVQFRGGRAAVRMIVSVTTMQIDLVQQQNFKYNQYVLFVAMGVMLSQERHSRY
jgi:hypothetical protein